ncbi:MAG TPA: hypothetical protein ENH82_19685 [bacterium]|nr:hypothetical protein [bacterium]
MGKKDNLIYFPNWADIDFITPSADRTVFCKLWKTPESFLIVLYSGSMRSVFSHKKVGGL